jgi:hypothetical protein
VAGGSGLSIPAHVVPVFWLNSSRRAAYRTIGATLEYARENPRSAPEPAEVAEVVESAVKFGSPEARKPLSKYGNNPYNNPELPDG